MTQKPSCIGTGIVPDKIQGVLTACSIASTACEAGSGMQNERGRDGHKTRLGMSVLARSCDLSMPAQRFLSFKSCQSLCSSKHSCKITPHSSLWQIVLSRVAAHCWWKIWSPYPMISLPGLDAQLEPGRREQPSLSSQPETRGNWRRSSGK